MVFTNTENDPNWMGFNLTVGQEVTLRILGISGAGLNTPYVLSISACILQLKNNWFVTPW